MADEMGSEEYLGEAASAGVPSLPVDRKGDPARWRDMDTQSLDAEEQAEATPTPYISSEDQSTAKKR